MAASLGLLVEYKTAINSSMAATLANLSTDLEVPLSERSLDAIDKLRDYSLRSGKRIRGSLAAAAYDQATNSHLAEVGIQLGVALELMQDYLLIVDDVMDKSVLRRGKPTIHELYLQDKRLDIHEAQMMAINVGLLAQHFAALVLARISAPTACVAQASRLMQTNIALTGFGQIDDLYQQPGRHISQADIIRKYQLKSSYYTFINPLQTGIALAGNATDKILEACRTFGLPAGVAFQLHDDMLGIFSDEDELGKSNLDDIREGKYTLLVQYALEHDSTVAARLMKILGKKDASKEDLNVVRELLVDCGAKAYVQSEMERYATKSLAEIAKTPWEPSFKEFLHQLVSFSIERSK